MTRSETVGRSDKETASTKMAIEACC